MGERVELPGEAPESIAGWINLRDDRGHVQARYHPGLLLLIIQDRGKKTIHDLKHHGHDQWLKVKQVAA